jgi:hypothetical protein
MPFKPKNIFGYAAACLQIKSWRWFHMENEHLGARSDEVTLLLNKSEKFAEL